MSALKERITSEMKAALLSGDRFRGDVLRNLKAAILNEEVSLGKREDGLDDAEITVRSWRNLKKKKRKFYENFCQSNLAKRKSQRL